MQVRVLPLGPNACVAELVYAPGSNPAACGHEGSTPSTSTYPALAKRLRHPSDMREIPGSIPGGRTYGRWRAWAQSVLKTVPSTKMRVRLLHLPLHALARLMVKSLRCDRKDLGSTPRPRTYGMLTER